MHSRSLAHELAHQTEKSPQGSFDDQLQDRRELEYQATAPLNVGAQVRRFAMQTVLMNPMNLDGVSNLRCATRSSMHSSIS